ncbi:MAG: TonB-dependent receptor [candidate division WOR-3 bacterium]|nr:MAG: TonB-dependent receptor [candidate division WOR-3 bacterium]
MIYLLYVFFIFNGISGKIQGTVRDDHTGEPISYADVILLDTDIGAATDDDGNFFILNVSPGIYTVEVSYIGYQTKHIDQVVVEINQTTRLSITLREAPIEISPITVTGIMPTIKKDMVGATYIVRKSELAHLPIDYTMGLVAFQPGVAHSDTAIHVRGGRATEVQYMIDNFTIIDPQTGDLAISVSRGIVDEVIFLPGGFDAEYGRAMSGVINLITSFPTDKLRTTAYAKTEKIMPLYYDFGYENYRSSIHLPISKRLKGFLSLDLMRTEDWDPRLFKLPHKRRDDYSLYGKWLFAPSGKFTVALSGARSRTQFDRYNTAWKFNLDHYRSDMRVGDLEALSISYLPNTRYLFNVSLSRLSSQRVYGVRQDESYGPFDNFSFQDYTTLEWPDMSIDNPFGIYYPIFYSVGDYPEYQDKSSLVLKANVSTDLQIHRYHELKAGFEYTRMKFDNFTYFVSDPQHQLMDEYHYAPTEYYWYIQNNIDYEGLYAKIGCRYDYFSSDVEGIEPKSIISPRVGFSFMVTEKFLFRANIGRYAQPPLYDQMYSYYNLLPFPSYITEEGFLPLVGNPNLGPEKTISFEIGLQGEVRENLLATLNLFYKDVADLIGTRLVPWTPHNYVEYRNVEYANVKGVEAILEFATSVFAGKVSYTLSWARGTSSYAEDIYFWYFVQDPEDTTPPPATEYWLDFDQRHRIFVQGIITLPLQTQMYLFGYFGEGFPYTPPGPEGKYEERNVERLPFQKQIDAVISKSLKLGRFSFTISAEILNLLDHRYEIAPHFPATPYENIDPGDFTTYISLHSNYYSPGSDLNHDGLITPYERYTSFLALITASDDWISAYTAPRRARIGVTINF